MGVLQLLAALKSTFNVILTACSASDGQTFPTDSTSSVQYNRAGTVTRVGNLGGSNPDWHAAPTATIGDGYEIFFHQNSGSTLAGAALDTWLALSTNRLISLTQTGGPATLVANLTVSIGLVGTSTAIKSATLDLSSAST